jgi:hypothetical protein
MRSCLESTLVVIWSHCYGAVTALRSGAFHKKRVVQPKTRFWGCKEVIGFARLNAHVFAFFIPRIPLSANQQQLPPNQQHSLSL